MMLQIEIEIVTMVKLGKHIYQNDELLYRYKGKIDIPSLVMVDDIMDIDKCSTYSVRINAVVNAL